MPSASNELRDAMKNYYGDPIDDAAPTKFLERQGFTLRSDWIWQAPPRYKDLGDLSEKEWLSVVFLCHEWDFGPVRFVERPNA